MRRAAAHVALNENEDSDEDSDDDTNVAKSGISELGSV
jgi:hypothetical protein